VGDASSADAVSTNVTAIFTAASLLGMMVGIAVVRRIAM
jgi:hypothetical protein